MVPRAGFQQSAGIPAGLPPCNRALLSVPGRPGSGRYGRRFAAAQGDKDDRHSQPDHRGQAAPGRRRKDAHAP